MPVMEVVLHLPTWTQDGFGGRGRRGDPGEWQNPTASPRSHNEDGDDETLLHARKGLCSKNSLGSSLKQPLPLSGCKLQTQQGFSRVGFALLETAPFLLQTLTAALKTSPSYISCGP